MPRKRLSMRKIKEVLRLKGQCALSHRQIAHSCGIGLGTVYEYLRRAVEAGVGWPLPDGLQEADLDRLLFPPPIPVPKDERPLPDWAEIHKELKRKGVTLLLLWQEHRATHPNGYGYSRFCELYTEWTQKLSPRMHQIHKAGEKLFVDYAGQTVPVIDRRTEVCDAQIFVATLGASSYTFAEATLTQTLQDWIGSHVRAFAFFGGVPEIVVPDNLKSGVKSPCFYEPDINPTYLQMARHYGVAIVPTRVRKPRDKAKVENAVQQTERRLLAPLRHQTFFELADLNASRRPLLHAHNHQPCQGLAASRYSLFQSLERSALRPLPPTPYEMALWMSARVHIDYHVRVDDHFYSVPHPLIKQPLDVRLSAAIVEFFHQGERVASHRRSYRKYHYTTVPEHMPPAHRWSSEWSPERFLGWAEKSGAATARLVEQILASRPHPQQAFRSCLGVLRLAEQHGSERVEAACARALAAQTYSYKSVKAILDNHLDQQPLPPVEREEEGGCTAPLHHANIRGAHYYGSTER